MRAFLAALTSRGAGELGPHFSPVLASLLGSGSRVEMPPPGGAEVPPPGRAGVPPPGRAGAPCCPPDGCILPHVDHIPHVTRPWNPSPRAGAVEGGILIVERRKEGKSFHSE